MKDFKLLIDATSIKKIYLAKNLERCQTATLAIRRITGIALIGSRIDEVGLELLLAHIIPFFNNDDL